MKMIKALVDQIEEELEGARCYTEEYLERKADGDNQWAGKYKSMAEDELKHAGNLHERAVAEIQKLRMVYTPPAEMEEKWTLAHREYIEKAAWIKTMLAM